MAVTPIGVFTPDVAGGIGLGAVPNLSTAVALLGTLGSDSIVRVTNLGPSPAGIVLGGSNVVATAATSLIILPGEHQYVALAGATYFAAIGIGGNAVLRAAAGN